jgi:hypothetical protein
MTTRIVVAYMLLAAGSLVLLGCGTKEAASPPAATAEVPAPEAPAGVGVTPPTAVVVTPEMTAILAEADAKDGQSDKTVSLCASCALKMEGSPEHTLKVGEYTMCFCQESCLAKFSEDIPGHVLVMKLPKADAGKQP